MRVPWAEEKSRFTALFEALAIDWMRQAAIAPVAERLRLSWDEAAGIQGRAVTRGLARRLATPVRHLGIDETAFARRHQYVTVVTDLDRSQVRDVADDRRQESLDAFWPQLSAAELATIEAVAMDMWEPYLGSIRAHLPAADTKIVFDKFHIAQHANNAVDKVRRQENRALNAEGHDWLVGTKFDWLRHAARFTLAAWREFVGLRPADQAQDRTGVGPQGDADDSVGLRVPRCSRAALRGLVRVGDSQPAGAHQATGAHVCGVTGPTSTRSSRTGSPMRARRASTRRSRRSKSSLEGSGTASASAWRSTFTSAGLISIRHPSPNASEFTHTILGRPSVLLRAIRGRLDSRQPTRVAFSRIRKRLMSNLP
ncbi:MAG: transposase [Candidatus Rokuibacteriota bacterium]